MMWRRGKTYSQDLRDRVLAADGESAREVAERLDVSVSYVVKARQRRDRDGRMTAGPVSFARPRRLAEHDDVIRQRVREQSDGTLEDLRAWLARSVGVPVSVGTMWNTVRRLGLTLKKDAEKKTLEASERARQDIAEARRLWAELQARLDVRRLIFLDEMPHRPRSVAMSSATTWTGSPRTGGSPTSPAFRASRHRRRRGRGRGRGRGRAQRLHQPRTALLPVLPTARRQAVRLRGAMPPACREPPASGARRRVPRRSQPPAIRRRATEHRHRPA